MTDKLRELEKAVRPGKWLTHLDGGLLLPVEYVGDTVMLSEFVWFERQEDAQLAASARNALPLLLDVVDAARECSDGFLDRYTIPPKAATERLAAALAALDAAQ